MTFAGRSTIQFLRAHLTVQRKHLFRSFQRPYSSKPPSSPAASQDAVKDSSASAITWYWLGPVAAPFRAYGRMQSRSPYMTQLSSSLTIYFLGDLSAQFVSGPGKDSTHSYEPIRGIRAMIIGGLSSIPSYKWFMFLGTHFNYSSHIVSLAVKIVINQTFFTPVFNTYFFGMQSLLSGSTLQEARRRVVDTVPVSWKNSWKVWPAVTAFSFTYIKPQFRNVFAGFVAIGWQTYLTWLNMDAARKEQQGKTVGGTEVGNGKEGQVLKMTKRA